MQLHDRLPTHERIVVVHTVRSWTEAVVVRGLLMSAGIESPELGNSGVSPMPDLAPLLQGIDIYALESQAEAARRVIADYFAEVEDAEDSPETSGDE
jgi:hypothetical protein